MTRSAIIFDLDGTLTVPYLPFDDIRKKIGVDGPILEAMTHMDAVSRERADAILHRFESDAAKNAKLQPGAAEVLVECKRLGHPVAILTRNSRAAAEVVLASFDLKVDAVRTRDDGETKPSGVPVLALCTELHADPKLSWMVGDYLFDIQAGTAAGARTVLLVANRDMPDYAGEADFVIASLSELLPIIANDKIVN